MNRNKFSIVVYVIIGLALIGIVSQLFTNPLSFLKGIFVFIVVGTALFSAVYFIFLRNKVHTHTNEMRKYKQAAKQSQLKYKTDYQKQRVKNKLKGPYRIRKKNEKRPTHLRVINSNQNKSKKNNRATF